MAPASFGLRRRLGAACLAACFAVGASLPIPAAAWFERPKAQAACAALDLHLVGLIETAGLNGTARPEALLAAFEGVLEARRGCAAGRSEQASLIYEAFAIELVPARAADSRLFVSLCGGQIC